MIFEEELKEKGFEFIRNVNDLTKVIYNFSDFETLSFYVREVTCADGSKALCVVNMNMYDYMNECYYFRIDYNLFYRDINEFYELLTLLGYGIR